LQLAELDVFQAKMDCYKQDSEQHRQVNMAFSYFSQACRLAKLALDTEDFLLDSLVTSEDNLVNLDCKYLTYRLDCSGVLNRMLDLVTKGREIRLDFFHPFLERKHHDVASLDIEKQES